ncbi:surface lipoprotein assembly modifier [Parahaliea mediterranea]|uniref:surface lipoprotein assembly modifier n=1 Tax=Parahaliea mediterranea TaxID=651086 RepID=UPI000E2FD427|nr:surface lipoprotein assembly modifier [Parahaliea mediterranea]
MRWPSGTGVLLALACCHFAHADEKTTSRPAEYAAEVGVGLEYDSNVAVDELDASSNQSDYAATLDAEVSMKKALSDKTDLGLSYDFNQNLYRDFDNVNRQTHILGANLSHDVGGADIGLTGFYINSRLDGSSFLRLSRLSPTVSGFLGKKWFGRAAYVYADKTLAQSPERDASTQAAEADLYFFRRGLRSYFNLGYRFRDEDAEGDPFDYQSNALKLRYIHRFDLLQRSIKLELAWRYEMRDYQSDTPSIGAEREDRRQRLQLDLEVPVMTRAALQFYAGYGDFESNFAPADYNQNIIGSRFIYRW